MKACRAYLDAPNPTPKPVVQTLWALSDEKGRFRRCFITGNSITLYTGRPPGYILNGHVFKPRRVRVTIEPIAKGAR